MGVCCKSGVCLWGNLWGQPLMGRCPNCGSYFYALFFGEEFKRCLKCGYREDGKFGRK